MCNNSREGTQKKLRGRIIFLLCEGLERFLNISLRTEMVPSHRMTSEIVSGFYLKDGGLLQIRAKCCWCSMLLCLGVLMQLI